MTSLVRMYSRCWLCISLLCFSCDSHVVCERENFDELIKRYYCSAHWICKDFETMRATELVNAWQQVVGLMTDARYRWFYAYDSPAHYLYRLNQHHSTIMRYNTESIDAEWLKECMNYHTFLTTHYIDIERDLVLIPDQKDRESADTRFVLVRTFLIEADAESVFLFYCFFFEQLANVMLKQMNYLHENSKGSERYIADLLRYQELLAAIYYVCVHCMESPSPSLVQKLAASHRCIDSVVSLFAMDLLKRGIA